MRGGLTTALLMEEYDSEEEERAPRGPSSSMYDINVRQPGILRPRTPPPPYQVAGGEPGPRQRRPNCGCRGWALALLLWGWILNHTVDAQSSFSHPQLGRRWSNQDHGSDRPLMTLPPPRELSPVEAAVAAARMGLNDRTKLSPEWWEPILRKQRNKEQLRSTSADLKKFRVEDFEQATVLPDNRTLPEIMRGDPTVVAGTTVWSQVWELLSLAEYAPRWKLDKTKHVRRMIKKLARNSNPVLQMLARGVLGKSTQEAAEMVQAEIGFASYCHDCQGTVCDRLCGGKEDQADLHGFRTRKKRSVVQDWVTVREFKHEVEVKTNYSTHGRPYIYNTEMSKPSNLAVPASVVVESNKFDPQMRLALDPPRHLHNSQRLVRKATEKEDQEDADYSLSLLAYDCSRPQVRTVQSRTEEDCLRKKPVVKRRTNVQYILLQEVPFVCVSAKKCNMTRSKLPVYCGNYDHQTLALADIWQNVPLQVEADKCQEMHTDKLHSVTAIPEEDTMETKLFPLALNTTNILSYEAYGKTTYANKEVECTGVKWFSEAKGKFVDSMMEWRNDVVVLEDTELLFDPTIPSLTTYQEQLMQEVAHCSLSRGQCVTTKGTWTWAPPATPMSTCRLYFVQEVQGEELILQHGDELVTIFIDNQKLLRFEVKPAKLKCGQHIYPTNFENFFLAERSLLPTFEQREVKGMDVDLAAHFRQQGNWIAGQIQTSFEDFAQGLLANLCKQDVGKYARSFEALAARQNAISTGGAVALQNGLFLTPVGEAWKIYKCQPIDVLPKETEKCYDSLPVQLPPGHVTLLYPNDTASTPPTVFLEPSSRILTTEGAEVPCVPQFGLYYRTSRGKWITSTPAIVEASAPKTLPHVMERPHWKNNWHEYKFDGSGIYPTSVLRKMQNHIRLPRTRELIPHAIWTKIDEDNLPSSDVLTRVTHALRVPDPEEWSILKHLRSAYEFVVEWGYVLSFAVGMWSICHFSGYALGMVERCLFPDAQKGCMMRMISALFPPITSLWDKITATSIVPPEAGKESKVEEKELTPIVRNTG